VRRHETPKTITIQREPEPLYPSGQKFVAYQTQPDGSLFPLYLAAETVEELKTRVLQYELVSAWIHQFERAEVR
jgi:hypothetical protein